VKGFDDALEVAFVVEGGFVNDPDDRGGATNMGVTQRTYDLWLATEGRSSRPVRKITKHEVATIYRDNYWNAVGADSMAWPLSLVMFDAAVNHGVHGANKLLQQALGVGVDGIVGPKTRLAMAGIKPADLANEVLWQRVEKYRLISTGAQLKFLRGWLWRIGHLRAAIAGK